MAWGGPRPNSGRKKTKFKLLPKIGPAWFVLLVAPQKEIEVEKVVSGLGYQTFIAFEDEVPVFRSVVFVQFDRDRDYWGELIRAPHVRRLIRVVGQSDPAPLPPGFVFNLQNVSSQMPTDEVLPPLLVGQLVTITDGPLAGQKGVVTECDGIKTTAEFSLLSASVLVTRPRSSFKG